MLDTPIPNDFAWPVDEALSSRGLDSVVAAGANIVLVGSSGLPGGTRSSVPAVAVAPLPSPAGLATALVTDAGLQQRATTAMASGATFADRQQLLAELALWPIDQPAEAGYVVIATSRYVDVAPDIAAATINATATTGWSSSVSPRSAARTIVPVDHGALVDTVVTDNGRCRSAGRRPDG